MNSENYSKPITPVEKYLNHLDNIFQQEPEFYKNESLSLELPGVTSIIYRNVPETGFITGLTYGLSLVEHQSWKLSHPELCISVKSNDTSWAYVAGYIANKLRGKCPFCYGEIINFGEPVSQDSEMDAFLIFAPSILEKSDFINIDVGANYKVNIAGLYPIYSSEIEIYDKIGLEKFWHHPNFDLYDVNRKKIQL